MKKSCFKKYSSSIFLFTFLLCLNISANTAFTGIRGWTTLQITADMGTGINLTNTLDAQYNETYWGNPRASLALITAWKKSGFKTLRIPVTWQDHLGKAPNYTIDPVWLARVEEVANYAFTNDMYVIIDAHHEAWYQPLASNDSVARDKLTKVWTQIANRFKNYGDYLILETMNEPRVFNAPDEWSGGNAQSRALINKFNLAAVNAIRNTGGNNEKRCILIPTYGANGGTNAINDLVIPNNDSLVIVSIHNYAPYSFCLQVPGTSTWGTTTDKNELTTFFNMIYDKFIKSGRAVVLGEWGAEYKNNTPSLITYYDFYANGAKSKQIATANWINTFDRNKLTWGQPIVTEAMVNPFKTNFVPVAGINLNTTTITIHPGDTISLTPTIAPVNVTSNSVFWTSSNNGIATVSAKGLVKGLIKGTATITATAIGKTTTCKVTIADFPSGTTNVETEKGLTIYPNPFTSSTTIQFQTDSNSLGSLKVFDQTGRKVATLINGVIPSGIHQAEFDGSRLSGGIYFYKLQTGNHSRTGKMILTK